MNDVVLGRKPIIVMTYMDQYPKDQHEDVRARMQIITGCSQIVMIDNTAEKSFETSKTYYKLLWAGLHTAGEYLLTREG